MLQDIIAARGKGLPDLIDVPEAKVTQSIRSDRDRQLLCKPMHELLSLYFIMMQIFSGYPCTGSNQSSEGCATGEDPGGH